jgi:putative heme transporter
VGFGPSRRLRDALAAAESRPVVVVLVAAALAVAAAVGLGDLAGFGRVRRELANTHPQWFAVCLGGELLAYLGYMLAVRDTARVDGGPKLDATATTRSVVAGFGVFAATRSSGGFAVDYWVLRRAGEDRDGAIARVLALGALEYAVLAPAALCSAIFLALSARERVPDALTLPWLLVIPGALAAAWVTSPRRAERFTDTTRDGRIRRPFAHAVSGLSILRSLLLASPLEHGLGFVGAALYWTGDIACLWGALQVYQGHRLSVPALILGYATGYVLTRRSLPAGGAGIVEIALTFALHWVGLPFVPALVGVVTYRLFNFWLPMIPAMAVLPAIAELRAQFAGAEASSDRVGDATGATAPGRRAESAIGRRGAQSIPSRSETRAMQAAGRRRRGGLRGLRRRRRSQ